MNIGGVGALSTGLQIKKEEMKTRETQVCSRVLFEQGKMCFL